MFAGWTDVDLTEEGIREGRQTGFRLAAAGYSFDDFGGGLWAYVGAVNWLPMIVTLGLTIGFAKGLSENKRIEPWFGGSLVKVEDSG
jgi:hypothetical protein